MTTETIIENKQQEKNEEYKLKPIDEIVKRYKRIVRESSKYYGRDADLKKLNHIVHIQKEILGWVLCQE
jgi:chemotaxis protein histidine kinase CheA